MKLVYLYAILFLATLGQLGAQDYSHLKDLNLSKTDNSTLVFFSRLPLDTESPSVSATWSPAIVLTSSDDTFAVLIAYPIIKDQLFFKIGETLYIAHPSKIKAVAAQHRIWVTQEYTQKDYEDIGYFELLYPSYEIHLLLKNVGSKNQLYIKQPGKIAKPFTPSRKSIYQLFPKKKRQLKQYFKTEKPKLNQLPDLIAVFKSVSK